MRSLGQKYLGVPLKTVSAVHYTQKDKMSFGNTLVCGNPERTNFVSGSKNVS